MALEKLKDTDLLGRFWFGSEEVDSYFQHLERIRPFVTSDPWISLVTGFYIGLSEHGLRLSYFTTSTEQLVTKEVSDFAASEKISFSNDPQTPHPKTFSEDYGGDELEFRRFLCTYTQIGLEILKSEPLHSRCLFATFCCQVRWIENDYRLHFESTFEAQSPFYKSLSGPDKTDFWHSFEKRPTNTKAGVDWAHMFVNMILPADFPQTTARGFSKPLSISQINQGLDKYGLGFQVPESWSP